MAYYIGVDLGTSGTKTVLFDKDGNTIASELYEYPMEQPKNGWAEQNPSDWWKATHITIKKTINKSGISSREIKGVGLSGQMHGLVMLDKNDEVIRPSIIWCDQRSKKECDQITEIVGKEKLIDITANPALPGFTASKILWVKNNEPENFEKAKKIMLPKDYVRYMLTGEFATEVSDASGMQLLNIKERKFSNTMLDALQIERSQLGKMYESCEVTGKITKKTAEITGLKEGTIVVGGAGDQAAGAVGNGIVKKGVVSSTIGTSGVVFANMDEYSIDPGGRLQAFCHAVPNKWHLMGVAKSSGMSLQWFRENFCQAEKETARYMDVDPYVLMDKEAQNVPIGSNGIIYLPYLMGERTPHLDSDCRGVFFGLSNKHNKRDLLRSVLEGVVFSLNDSLQIIKEVGVDVNEVIASGGGGKSPLWRQIQADVFGVNINTTKSSQGPALGVGILASVGAGEYDSVEEACENIININSTQQPNIDNNKTYSKYYKLFNKLYGSLKDDFRELTEILEG